jgi:hypothetical protein
MGLLERDSSRTSRSKQDPLAITCRQTCCSLHGGKEGLDKII